LESAIFSWDEANIRHLARHGVSKSEAEQCYRNDPLIIEEQFAGKELRYLALGETNASRRLEFVFTLRHGQVRFITAYPMALEQQRIYEEG